MDSILLPYSNRMLGTVIFHRHYLCSIMLCVWYVHEENAQQRYHKWMKRKEAYHLRNFWVEYVLVTVHNHVCICYHVACEVVRAPRLFPCMEPQVLHQQEHLTATSCTTALRYKAECQIASAGRSPHQNTVVHVKLRHRRSSQCP